MKLTKQQVDHIEKRIKEKLARDREALTKKYMGPGGPRPDTSNWTKYQLIKSGKAKLHMDYEPSDLRYSGPDLVDAYSYPELDAKVKKWDESEKKAKVKIDEGMRAKKKEANKLLDQIMLSGDAEGALALLEKFMSS